MPPQSLRSKVHQILFLVALTAFILSSLLTAVVQYHKIKTEYSVSMRARMNVASALMKNELYKTDAVLQSILEQALPDQLEELLSQLASSRYFEFHGDSFYVLDQQGKVLLISEPYTEYKGLDFSAMISAKSTENKQVHHHYQSLLSKHSVVTIQYPLANGNLLIIERNLAYLTAIMNTFKEGKLYEGELFFALSAKGQAIYHPDPALMATRHNIGFDLKKRTVPDANGLFSFLYQGRRFIALSDEFAEPSDWIMYYCIPGSVMAQAIGKVLLNQLIFLLLLFCLFFFVLRVLFNRFFSQPVKSIVGALDQSKQGEGLFLTPDMSAGTLEFNTIIEAINSRDETVANMVDRFQAVLDGLDAVVYVADLETYEILFINSYGQQFSGDCIGKTCYRVLQEGQDEPCPFCTNHLLVDDQGKPTGIHVWEIKNTKNQHWYQCRDQAIRWTDGRLVRMEIAIDISPRKEAEEALLAEKERLAVTLRSIGDGVITTDTEGKIVFLNKVAEELTGWSNEEAQGKPSPKIFNIINEKTGQKCVSPIQRVMELGRTVGLANHTALIAKDGTLRSIADSGAPIRDRESKIIGVVLVFRDVSHEKKIEEEILKVRKLESLGVLAGGIAHDFNNILAAILGNIELASYRIAQDDTRTAALLSDASKATNRATRLTQQLLTFSKGGDPVKEATTLPDLIPESADFVLHGSRVVCTYTFPDDLKMVDVDSGQINQVIQNITLNAKHAMPEGGTITIQCANVKDAATEALLSVDKGDYVRITIQDTGIGISREIVGKIFDPYFTTKQEGSGLGLAICHSIINKHDGYLTVNSIVGKGTTFTVYLPARLSTSKATLTNKPGEVMTAVKAARVMVMDDEEMLLNVAEAQLTVLGHETVLVADGDQAINRYQELQDQGTPVDIVIMDLTIPGGMGGQEAAQKLLQIDPDAKIIVSSGYSNDPVMADYRQHGFCAAIPKPFDLAELSKVVESVLRAP